jgi:hypothetical protein
MSEIKFTTDGKKVIIVGKLNSQETIVQEIFISESGAEIPSGENFVVRSLHDAPVESWKEKNLRELEIRYESERKSWEKKIEDLNNRLRKQQKHIEAHIESIGAHLRESQPESFDLICGLLGGRLNVAVINEYGKFTISELTSSFFSNEYGFRLISLFGRNNGDMQMKLNRYSDGSGGWDEVKFFESEQQAKDWIISEINSKPVISRYSIETAEKYGLEIDPKKLEAYFNEEKGRVEKRISDKRKELEGLETELLGIISPAKATNNNSK